MLPAQTFEISQQRKNEAHLGSGGMQTGTRGQRWGSFDIHQLKNMANKFLGATVGHLAPQACFTMK